MIRNCQHCQGSGYLCVACNKPRHLSAKARDNQYNSCWRLVRRKRLGDRSKPCPDHKASIAVCDMCSAEAPAVYDHRYKFHHIPADWKKISGLRPGERAFDGLELCPSCQGTVRVGFDWSLDRAGEPLLSESIACAFAFQVGLFSPKATAEYFRKFEPTFLPVMEVEF